MGELKLVNTTDFGMEAFLANQISDHTKRAYSKDLADFSMFLSRTGQTVTHPTQLTIPIFLSYRDALIAKGVSPKTLNRKFAALKSLMRWFHLNGHILSNQLSSLKMPKAEVISPTQALTDDEVVKVLQVCKSDTETLIFEFLFKLGLRRSEVLNITISDFIDSRGHRVLRIKGKGSKVRELPLSVPTQQLVSKYLTKQKCEHRLFNLSDSTIYRIVKLVFKRAGLNAGLSPHSCRATVISHLLDTQQIPIRDVSDFAGHSSINTTSLYDKKRKGLENSPAYKVNYGE